MRILLLAGLLLVVVFVLSARGHALGRRRRVLRGLRAAGHSPQPAAPAGLGGFDRLGGDPGEVLWHAHVAAPREAFICGLASGPVVAWRSARASRGALAIRPHAGEVWAVDLATGRYDRLALIRAATLPAPYDALDLFLEMPDSAPLFFGTAIGEGCLNLRARDLPFTFEYQDGWCRLRLDRLSFEDEADFRTALEAAARLEDALLADKPLLGPYRIEVDEVREARERRGRGPPRRVPICSLVIEPTPGSAEKHS